MHMIPRRIEYRKSHDANPQLPCGRLVISSHYTLELERHNVKIHTATDRLHFSATFHPVYMFNNLPAGDDYLNYNENNNGISMITFRRL